MATLAVPYTRRSAVLTISPAMTAGLMVGAAEALFFIYALARAVLHKALGRPLSITDAPDIVDGIALVVLILATVGAGVGFALLLSRHFAWWRVTLAGISLLVTSLSGVVIAGALEPLESSVGTVRAFQIAFTIASGCAALLCSLAVGWLLRIDGTVRKAVLVGMVTAIAYVAFALLIDRMPGWRVGGGDMAMPRVAMLGNLVSAGTGGAFAFRLFQR
ncbi:MAG TPA: hypothetical protein VFG86_25215 [Chloroflexota bacterium]|nr:hypothetical protein [Chloroflexota bacterium]